jgi:hypothetical protein
VGSINSRKSNTIVFGKSHSVSRLAGFGIKRAQKYSLIAPVGRAIACRMEWGRGKRKGRLVWAITVFGVRLRVTPGGRFLVDASGFRVIIIVCRCQGGVQKPVQPAGGSLPEVSRCRPGSGGLR